MDVRAKQRLYLLACLVSLNLCGGSFAPRHLSRSLAFCFARIACQRAKIYHRVMNYHDIITIEPGKRGGKPCIRGMRMTVYDVLEYLASGMTTQEILDDFPYLTHDDIMACLAFAADREKNLLVVQA